MNKLIKLKPYLYLVLLA